jgi:hypothetical protein
MLCIDMFCIGMLCIGILCIDMLCIGMLCIDGCAGYGVGVGLIGAFDPQQDPPFDVLIGEIVLLPDWFGVG